MTCSSSNLYHLLCTTTFLVICILISLVFFASDLQNFEEKCRHQIEAFKEFETSAWDDIIVLEKLHTRSKRQAFISPPRKTKRAKPKTKRRKLTKHQQDSQRYATVADKLSELSEYANSDRSKETDEIPPEGGNTNSEGGDPYDAQNGGQEATTASLILSKSGLAQLLEIHNDKDENEEEDSNSEGQSNDKEATTDEDNEENEEAVGEGGGEEGGDEECADDEEYCYGNPCPRGPPGPPGQPGLPGEDAPDGTNGTDGQDWSLGTEDRVVVLGCVKCPAGPRGTEGDPGPPGDKGGPGPNGNPGLDGYEAYPGGPGLEGYPGEDGDYGNDGWPGPAGENAMRYANLPGNRGLTGIVGEQGEPGDPGEVGSGGLRGLAGTAGAPGKHGIPGPPGLPGLPGEPGAHGIGHVGQCSCPHRRNEYPRPPPQYRLEPPPPPPVEYITNYVETTYITTTEEPTTTSVYRYFVKAEAPTEKAEYIEPTTPQYINENEYSSGYGVKTDTPLYQSADNEPKNPSYTSAQYVNEYSKEYKHAAEPPTADEPDDSVHRPAIPTDFVTR